MTTDGKNSHHNNQTVGRGPPTTDMVTNNTAAHTDPCLRAGRIDMFHSFVTDQSI